MAEAFVQSFGWVTGFAAGLFAIYAVIVMTLMFIDAIDKLIQKG